jgi:hypothetical protein
LSATHKAPRCPACDEVDVDVVLNDALSGCRWTVRLGGSACMGRRRLVAARSAHPGAGCGHVQVAVTAASYRCGMTSIPSVRKPAEMARLGPEAARPHRVTYRKLVRG